MEIRRRRTPALSSRDQGVIDLERKYGSAAITATMKFEEAERTLGLNRVGYALVLKALLDDPIAHEYDPETIGRLRAAAAGARS